MKTTIKILWGSAILFGVATALWLITHSRTEDKVLTLVLDNFIEELSNEADDIFAEYIPIDFYSDKAEYAQKLTKEKWYLYARKNDKTVYWNSNKVNLDSAVEIKRDFPLYFNYGDDTYVVFSNEEDAYVAFRIANAGKVHDRLIASYPEIEAHKLDTKALKQFADANHKLTFYPILPDLTGLLWVSFLLTLVLLILCLHYFRQRSKLLYVLSAAMVVFNLILFWLSSLDLEHYYFLTTDSFILIEDKELCLRLFTHIFTGLTLLISLLSFTERASSLVQGLSRGLALIFSIDFLHSLTVNLAEKSSISYDFEKLFQLSFYSFFSIALLGFSFLILGYAIYVSVKQGVEHRKTSILGLLTALVVFIVFQIFDGHRTISSLWQPIILLVTIIALWLIARRRNSRRLGIYLYFLFISFFLSILVYSGHKSRENKYLQSYAKSIINSTDPRAELLLKGIENRLSQEFLTPEDYRNFIFKKDIIESRIKNLYFSNYLEKYELKLLSFGPNGENINENTLYSFEDLNKVYNEQTERTESDYFYQITSPSSFSGYIAKYENCDIDGHFGSTFILLQPRIVQSEFLYPEVFENQKNKELVTIDDYSYGIYYESQLISQKGSYPYRLTELPDNILPSLFSFGDYNHTRFIENGYQVILSKPENRLKSWLSSFTFTVIILLLVCIITSLLIRRIASPKHDISLAFLPGHSRFLSARIQTSLTIILLVGLLLSVYIIINYIRAGYNQNLENQLLVKVKNISTRLQNKIDLEKKLDNPEQRVLMLNEESSTYKVDINLFNNDGKLLASTKPYLTSEEILGDHMNPNAYLDLTRKQTSQLLVREELEGSDYLSAYVPLFDGKNKVIGYLNTPFFAQNEQLNKQISNLVVNILNIYFLLLLGGIILAYIISRQISKPLLLIREKIAKTVLRGQNELITYNRDDEIGQLVKQYNKMVMELEESANQMAESEREGAWREMAKQVAHEIKNPLTPMKLSIQHLQRAYEHGPSEKLDKLFKKTSQLLIDQINSLSNMASEFSNFAQMPVSEKKEFDVATVLSDTVVLFNRSENVQITSDIDGPAMIEADAEQIKRVFNNLIKNAIQAIPDGIEGKIEVRLSQSEDTAVITVSDNGKGIPTSNYKKVFVPNFSTKNSGMGLGLAISKKIVENAKGNISFTSKVNSGTTFTVTLPTV